MYSYFLSQIQVNILKIFYDVIVFKSETNKGVGGLTNKSLP